MNITYIAIHANRSGTHSPSDTQAFSARSSQEFALQRYALPNLARRVFGSAITKPYIRALMLLSRLRPALPRCPGNAPASAHQPNPPPRPTPPVFTPPGFAPPGQLKTSRWMWFARILPTLIAPNAATCRAELQQLLSEPAMQAVFAQAPALRRHLHPLCRALGVTLPGDPAPPPDPEPAPVRRRASVPGESFIHGRDPTPE